MDEIIGLSKTDKNIIKILSIGGLITTLINIAVLRFIESKFLIINLLFLTSFNLTISYMLYLLILFKVKTIEEEGKK